jgi:hypothetical protein
MMAGKRKNPAAAKALKYAREHKVSLKQAWKATKSAPRDEYSIF